MKINILIISLSIILFGLLTTIFMNQNSNKEVAPTTNSSINQDLKPIPSNTAIIGNNKLDISGRNLDKVPDYVFNETSLEYLNISYNNLSGAIPSEIGNLTKLVGLIAGNNKMTGVPAEIGKLEKLQVLDLSNNQLKGLPYELGNLKKLKVLDLSGNNYSKADLEIIMKSLPVDVQVITD